MAMLLTGLSPTLEAQRIRGFVAAGGAVSQVEGDELKGFKQLGLNAGVGAMIDLTGSDRLLLDVEVLYAQRGAWQKTTSDNVYCMNLYLNYVDIPLLLTYHDPIGGIIAGAGLTYGRLVQQPHSVIYYNDRDVIPDTAMNFLKNDLTATVDFRFPIWRGLQIDLRWQYSLIAIRKDWQFAHYDGKDAYGNYRYKYVYNNAYNHSLVMRLIWQF